MFNGYIILEDHILTFNTVNREVSYSITDNLTGDTANMRVPLSAFTKALAIAVHIDGLPSYKKDYPEAESVMPSNRNLRWIPE